MSSRNRTPTQLVRQLAKETNSSPHYQDRPAAPIPATPDAAHTHMRALTAHTPKHVRVYVLAATYMLSLEQVRIGLEF